MIYLDHHAATPCAEAARRAMAEARAVGWANPSSKHRSGQRARALLEEARARVAEAVGARPADLVLTSGGTEACNLGVLGLAPEGVAHVITTRIEHPAIARAVDVLEKRGARVTRLEVPEGIAPDARSVSDVITDEPTLAAFQWVNHETGTLLPVESWTASCRARGARVILDATQALGKIDVSVDALGADALAFAGHKMGGPAGSGALYVRRGLPLCSRAHGGAQERGRRAGTPDVVSAVGFGAACSAVRERLSSMPRVARLRARLEAAVREMDAEINGDAGERVATVVNASFRGFRGEVLVAALDVEGLEASSGAACSSGVPEPSPVLLAMYPDAPWRATSALRLSLGPEVDEALVDRAIEVLARVVARRPPT